MQNIQRTAARARRREALCAAGFLLPSLLGVSVLWLIPTLDVIRRSFCSAMGDVFVGLANYQTIWQNESLRLAASNTGRFLIVCIPLLLSFSLLVALGVSGAARGADFIKTSLLMPMAVPVTSVVLILRVAFAQNGLLTAPPLHASLLTGDAAFRVLVLCYLWKNIGYHVVLWLAGLSSIPRQVYEAARIDGAGAIRQFTAITWPLLRPACFTSAVLALINSFKVFREAYLVGGRYPTQQIYMLQHVLSNWFENLDMQKVSAAAVCLMAAVALAVALLRGVSGDGKDEA